MPVGQTLAGTEGAAFGFFPILWIVINAIWVYQMTVETGHFDVLRRSFSSASDDQRIHAIIIAFSFGALIEPCCASCPGCRPRPCCRGWCRDREAPRSIDRWPLTCSMT